MLTIILIIGIIAAVLTILIVLIQNPKGGGLSGNIAGFSNQFMGVKQTTDVLEKGTWLFAAIVGILCLLSSMFISGSNANTDDNNLLKGVPTNQQAAPPSTTPAPSSTPAQPQK